MGRLYFFFGFIALVANLGLLTGCQRSETAAAQKPLFKESAQQLGIDFLHHSGEQGRLYIQAILGAGAVVADFDGDRDLDLVLVESDASSSGSKLYKNLLIEQDALLFVDYTSESGLNTRCYGTGASAADFDNDGDVDLYITCYDANELWVNDGQGTFTEMADHYGLDDPRWTAASAWIDFDNDGWLDLFIGNYLDYTEANYRECRAIGGVLDYCGPLAYDPAPNRYMRNTGSGFEDVTISLGFVNADHAPALGAVVGDFNEDGETDLYIANDAWPNDLWLNRGDHFENDALLAGVAVNTDGQAEASMGVDAGDYDGDGDDDLVMVHMADEKATLYAYREGGLFDDRTMSSNIGPLTRGYTGFGAAWIDVDMDSWLDLFIVNGRVRLDRSAKESAKDNHSPYAQQPLLLGNLGDHSFANWSTRGGTIFNEVAVSRGAAFGDLDNDGDLDVVVNNIDAAPWVLIGQANPSATNWFGVDLIEHDRAAHGARAGLLLDNGRTIWRRVRVDGSYAAANDPRLQFAVSDDASAVELLIQWSDGSSTKHSIETLIAGQYVQIRQADRVQP